MPNVLEERLVSPVTGDPLRIEDGRLVSESGEEFPLRSEIPRFVADEGYNENFGDQWRRYRLVQLDSVTGKPLSRDRLYAETGWDPEQLAGQTIADIGCGAGRFTEVLLADGAEVWAVDASLAVEACRLNNGENPRLHVLQADLFALPFRNASFDRLLCYGVVQHTPDPKLAFRTLARLVKPGGLVAVDVYRVADHIDRWSSKYLWRWLTTRLPRSLVRRWIEWYMPLWLPVDTRLARVPRYGRLLSAVIPCWNYSASFDLNAEELRAWAILDTFDALTARYDKPQTLDSVREWTEGLPLTDVEIRYGGNGIVLNARMLPS